MALSEKELKNYQKAGKIMRETQKFARKLIKPGMKMLEAADKIEGKIIELGGKPAFPSNLSVDNVAAHYTPSVDDETIVGEKDVLKVDLGIHIDGYIADAAFTLDFSNEQGKMVEAAEKALETAVSMVKAGAETKKIGAEIQKTIEKYGFKPVANLNGHGLGRYNAHAIPSIPNIAKGEDVFLEDNDVIALEPFATDGTGYVREVSHSEIFELEERKPVRDMDARKILAFVEKEYNTLPFAERWVAEKAGVREFKRKVALRELLQRKCILAHPPLKEEEGKIVTQAETCIALYNGEVHVLV